MFTSLFFFWNFVIRSYLFTQFDWCPVTFSAPSCFSPLHPWCDSLRFGVLNGCPNIPNLLLANPWSWGSCYSVCCGHGVLELFKCFQAFSECLVRMSLKKNSSTCAVCRPQLRVYFEKFHKTLFFLLRRVDIQWFRANEMVVKLPPPPCSFFGISTV